MKSKCITCVVVATIGATIGMVLAYLFLDPMNASNLATGAVVGGMIGLYFSLSAAVPSGNPNSGRKSGIGGMG